jgi:hypothetical protein
LTPTTSTRRKRNTKQARATPRRAARPRRRGGRLLLVWLGIVWLALAVVATLGGVYSERVLHSPFAVDAAITGALCSAAVATFAFTSAAGRKP